MPHELCRQFLADATVSNSLPIRVQVYGRRRYVQKHYSITWNQTTTALYNLKAKLVKTGGVTVDSPVTTVRVNRFPRVLASALVPDPPHAGDSVANNGTFIKEYYYYPVPNVTYPVQDLRVSATASDADAGDTITKLELYSPISALLLRSVDGASFANQAVQPKLAIGNNGLTTVSRDNWGCETINLFNLRIYPGALDQEFTPPTYGGNRKVNAVAIQANGKIVIGGAFTGIGGIGRNRIARLNTDGSLDQTFLNGLTGANGEVNTVVIQPDGKILIGGSFTTVNGSSRNRIARLNSDGTLDGTFNPGTGVSGGADPAVYSLVVQSDGKVLIGGNFTTFDGVSRARIARLNANGSRDNAFDPGNGATGGDDPTVYSVKVQSDGQVLIAGGFNTVNGTTRNRIARLTSDGNLDTTFSPSIGVITGEDNSLVRCVVVQSDGRIVIGGEFTAVNGERHNRIARLNISGSPDSSFLPGVNDGANGTVRTITLQADGRFFIGGDFTKLNNVDRKYVGRLNTGGSLDSDLRPSPAGNEGLYGPTAAVLAFGVQANSRIVLGGQFATYGVPGVTPDTSDTKLGIVRLCGP